MSSYSLTNQNLDKARMLVKYAMTGNPAIDKKLDEARHTINQAIHLRKKYKRAEKSVYLIILSVDDFDQPALNRYTSVDNGTNGSYNHKSKIFNIIAPNKAYSWYPFISKKVSFDDVLNVPHMPSDKRFLYDLKDALNIAGLASNHFTNPHIISLRSFKDTYNEKL